MNAKLKKNICLASLGILIMSECSEKLLLKTVNEVDLDRFMGNWYVIGNIPTYIEKDAYNAVDSYKLNQDGTVATTFTFHKGSFDGKKKTYTPLGFVREKTGNAVWDMQFIWPIKAEYLIIYLNDDYTLTLVGRSKRDYVWIMARNPSILDDDYKAMLKIIKNIGYDISKIQKIPQKWE